MAELPSLTIAQYAGIRAALAEGHPLETALALEGLPQWRWPEVDLELTDALTSNPELFETYSQKLAEAEDWLARDVTPLSEDLASWVGFVAVASPDTIAQLGLLPTDMGRLQRSWQTKFEADKDLSKEAAKLAAEPPPPPDKIVVADAALRPFPWSPGAQQANEGSALEPLDFLTETAKDARKAPGPTIPFEGYRPPPPGTLEIELTPELGQTAPLESRRNSGPATPFEPASEPAPSTPEPSLPAASNVIVVPSPPLEPILHLGTTAPAKPMGPADDPLPFSGQHAPPAAADLEPHPALGLTASVEPREPLSPIGSSLEPQASLGQTVPVAPASYPEPADWTAEDYGRFTADLDMLGNRNLVFARWHVPDAASAALIQKMWRSRFDKEPALRARFAAALKRAKAAR